MPIKPLKAGMLNKQASSRRCRPEEILKALDIGPGYRIADIGAGGGYFTLRFAEAVGKNGLVYAVDTRQDFLAAIDLNARAKGLCNIRTLLVSGEPSLPEKIDLIFMRNIYHHLSDRSVYFKTLRPFLRRGGRLAIIEHKPDAGGILSFRRLFGHSTPKETIISEVTADGYNLMRDYDILPEQNFLLFSPI